MRWLLNRYCKQRDLTRYLPTEQYTQWVRWPKHMTALTKLDAKYIDGAPHFVGMVIYPGGGVRMIFHPGYFWYYDGEHAITFHAILFPDGTEWRPFE